MKRLLSMAMMVLAVGAAPKPMGTGDVLRASKPSDWRAIAPDNLLVMTLPAGRVVIELAPQFAPLHAANIRMLAREHWFDGTTINRVQENYVTQWGDATEKKPLGSGAKTLTPEFDRAAAGMPFTPLPGTSGYGREGFSDSWPTVEKNGRAWLAHCYPMVGAGRNDTADSGPGSELYAVIGQAPRHLDRNATLIGRVVQGMEHLTSLPRGTGDGLGMYETAAERVPIAALRLATELPEAERPHLEVLRTDTPAWAAYVDARAHRSRDGWFVADAGFVDLCNIRAPIRETKR